MRSLICWRLLMSLVLLFLVPACSCDPVPPAGADGGDDAGSGADGGVSLGSLELSPAGRGLAVGTSLQLTATAHFTDGTTQDVTGRTAFASSAPSTAAVTAGGRVSALAPGTAIISATFEGQSASMTVLVTSATLQAISVSPPTATLARGTARQLSATGIFSDNTSQDLTDQVTWASSATGTATVSPTGLAQGVGPGSATISAAMLGVSGSAAITVTTAALTSLAISPATVTLAPGTQQQFTAIGTFSDNSTQDLTALVSWSSSSLAVASLSTAAGQEGLVRAVAVGTATITASRDGLSGSAALTVTTASLSSLSVTPATVTLPVGTSQALMATGTFSDGSSQDLTRQVSWSSSSPATASVSNTAGSEGVATAAGAGTASVSATFNGVSAAAQVTVTAAALSSLAVTPANANLTVGATQQYTATGTFSDGTMRVLTAQVTWTSSNLNTATISNAAGSEGLASAQGLGGTSISATLMGISGSTNLTVGVIGGATLQSLAVTPANATMAPGTTRQYTATGSYSDGSTRDLTAQAVWASSNTTTATVSNMATSKGLVSAQAGGTTTLSATFQAVSGSTSLTVSQSTLTAIAVVPSNPGLPASFRLQFRATGTYSDGSTQDVTAAVTWASANAAVATISGAATSKGLATGLSAGTSSISATLGAISGSTSLTVSSATLSALTVTPASFSLGLGQSRQLTATGTFSDGSSLDLTNQVTWSSSSFRVQVSQTGLVTVLSAGGGPGGSTAVITATRNASSGTSTVTLTP